MQRPQTPTSQALRTSQTECMPPLPDFKEDQPLSEVIRELSHFRHLHKLEYFVDAIEAPHTFEQLRTASVGHILKPLVGSLSDRCRHSGIVAALMIVKWHFSNVENDDRGIFETRGFACEIVAWRFLAHLSKHELIDYLLRELPPVLPVSETSSDGEQPPIRRPTTARMASYERINERTYLLFADDATPQEHPRMYETHKHDRSRTWSIRMHASVDEDPTLSFVGLNALEIATVAGAKQFLSQRVVQDVINGIWSGDIIFWESLSIHTRKKAQTYHQGKADLYCRLRVPKYQKVFEAAFFAIFLILYYAVLVERNPRRITVVEVLLYIWIAAFACDEFGEFKDAGTLFYAADFWSLWDVGIVGIGAVYLILRIIGLARDSDHIIDVSFDILSLEALFLVPRVCSLLSLNPYFGTLIPCLKEMTKDFVKFLGIVIILFFGSSYLGFDIASEISPALGPTLMLFFVILTNFLLLTSLIAILSQSLTKVMDHAREEYLFQYSVFVLEASASRRLTYFFPPLNLLPLILFRPLRLCIPSEQLRNARIMLLRATHFPYVATIWIYENASQYWNERRDQWPHHMGSRKRAMHANRIDFSNKATKYSVAKNRSDASLMAPRSGSEGRTAFANDPDAVAGLQRVMGKLNRQEEMIEKLSRQVEKLAGHIHPSPKAEADE
ncbi:MAG: hypothetical protein LQ338_002202 [Usnochroma carphineum]|nr:MAG: hypothetical protein LQ338_002202 [Usnochroma carphineum]